MKILKRMILLLLLGIGIGSILGNVFRSFYEVEFTQYLSLFYEKIKDYGQIENIYLGEILKNRVSIVLGFLFFSMTGFFEIYVIVFPIYQGFSFGFLFTAMCLCYGGYGIVASLAYIFPQFIIYAIVVWFALKQGFRIHEIYHMCGKEGTMGKKAVKEIPCAICIFLLLILGCYVESHYNIYFVKKTLGMFLK